MASYLVCSTPVRGHVSPLLTVSRTLVEGGHRVRFLTGSRFREEVEASGARWVPLPPEAEFDDRDVDAAFPGRVGLTGVAGARFDLGQIFLAAAPRQLEAVDALLAEEAADAVLTETMFFGALLLLCRPADLRPPVVNLGIVPLALHSRHTAPFALGIPPRDGALGQVRNVLLGWVTDHLVFGGLHRTAARMARERTGFPLRAHATDYISLADAIVQFTVADFEYPRPDSGTPVHFVGPMTRRTAPDAPPEALPAPVAGDAHPVPPWWGDLAAAREAGVPIVHLTQGTIANADPEDLILPTVRALAEERVLVVVSSAGRSIPASQLPANVRVADFLPYDLLFPQLSALVTNGGYGGVQFALAHGVPVVAIGNTEDKAEVAARVAWSGAGLRLRPSRTGGVDPDVVGAAVRRVLAESAFRTRCRQLAAAIAASPGPQGIEAVLDEVTAPCHVPADLTRH